MSARAARFSSRFALLASMLGIAIGTGNIWRFPRIAAQNGGGEGAGAFLVAWVVCLVTWSVPLIVAEYAVGRVGRRAIVGTFAALAGQRLAWMGAFVGLVATAIMFYYSVVAGWCLYYLAHSITAALPAHTGEAKAVWDELQGGYAPVWCHLLAIGGCGLAAYKGVSSIEKANQILVPTLVIVVLVSVLRALTLPGAYPGVQFLFTPEWASLARPRVWLEALTQNAWDTGAGWGLILTYAAYMRRRDYVVKNAVATGVGNNLVSLLAALMIFATVFAVLGADRSQSEVLEVMQDSGPASTGLTFIWMPQLFARMAAGRVFAILFFLGLSFAALSSLISMVELATGTLVDAGLSRSRALLLVVTVGFALGVPSALDVTFLSNQDFVWGLGLIISGALVAAAVVRYGTRKMRLEVLARVAGDWRLGRGWDWIITLLVPLQALLLLGWWMYLSSTSYAPDSWYNPLDPFSVATCLAQWSLGLALCWIAARVLVRRLRGSN
jgi:NSS family neurotransmitter:Na+ symporter